MNLWHRSATICCTQPSGVFPLCPKLTTVCASGVSDNGGAEQELGVVSGNPQVDLNLG